MKRYLIIFYILFVTSLTVSAQHPRGRIHFDPARFKADMEQYIAREACLTPKEASEFFPLFDEMLRKERASFDQMSNISRVKPATEKGCADAVKKRDELEIQIKELEQQYHNRFMKILPASKVFDVIKAQNHFHRQMFKNRMGRGR
jgi:hypothetical protein